jgi:hypothetical protein
MYHEEKYLYIPPCFYICSMHDISTCKWKYAAYHLLSPFMHMHGAVQGEICCLSTYGPYQKKSPMHISKSSIIHTRPPSCCALRFPFSCTMQINATSNLLSLGGCYLKALMQDMEVSPLTPSINSVPQVPARPQTPKPGETISLDFDFAGPKVQVDAAWKIRASPAGRPKRTPRVRICPSGQTGRKTTTQRADLN